MLELGAICTTVASSTKPLATSLKELLEIMHLKTAPCPLLLTTLSSGVLTSAQVHETVPFPCSRPCGVGLVFTTQRSPP
eukprot:3519131-Ditylum_brightwellii.AAC.1